MARRPIAPARLNLPATSVLAQHLVRQHTLSVVNDPPFPVCLSVPLGGWQRMEAHPVVRIGLPKQERHGRSIPVIEPPLDLEVAHASYAPASRLFVRP